MSTPTEPGLEEVISERRHLLALAYRLLVSVAEAEDAVQETYARWCAMTPTERVALVLHDVFAYSFDSIGEITGCSAAACCQLASSARRRIRAAHVPATPTGRQTGVVHLLKAAWSNKDIDAIMELLDPDVTVTADGGGRAKAFSETIRGADNVARAWLALADWTHDSLAFDVATVNGQPGLVVRQDRCAVAVYAFHVAADRIRRVWVVRNPDKLRAWQAVNSDTRSLPDTQR